MIALKSSSFKELRSELRSLFLQANPVENHQWQGVDVRRNPSARMHELRNVVFEIPLGGVEDLDVYRDHVGPNLPWADDHFLERVGGEPLNPGVEWARWPWATSADGHRNGEGMFNHTYMERLWPRWARRTPGGRFTENDPCPSERQDEGIRGICHPYGDLSDLVSLLIQDPFTRQAWIPLFFPEDTGVGDGGRKPCTLGYQLLRRGNGLHMWYPLRSCDLFRHFPDDVYLAIRLMLWVLDRCREQDPESWQFVGPETYAMHCTSLHGFVNDLRTLRS